MTKVIEISCLSEEEQEKITAEIEARIEEKKREGVVSEHEIREIEEMRLRPLPDIQDVQSVYEDFLFRTKG